MRVLVTGGAGFIGSHVVDLLAERGDEVRVLDNLSPAAHSTRPDYLRGDVDYVFDDVRNGDAVASAIHGIDAIIHSAAMVGLGVDLADIGDYVSNNDDGTATLIRAMHDVRFEGPFVLSSSMVVYGEGAYRCEEHGRVQAPPRAESDLLAGRFEPGCPSCGRSLAPQSVPETAPPDPRNIYAATKLHQEHLAQVWAREAGQPVFAMRYHNVYGPRMPANTPYAGVASIFRSALASGEAPRVFEDGNQMRDFIHVVDVARATIAPLSAEASLSGAYNVASGHPHTVGEMARELAGAFPGDIEPVLTGAFRLGDVRHVFASTDKARELLDFVAVIGFGPGMREFASAPLRGTP